MSITLFSTIQLGQSVAANRIFMAPLTRCRASPEDHVPSELMVQHYADRASAGLIITECCMITPKTSVFYGEPGVYSPEQLRAWKKITDAVHARGGKIFCQLYHAGRTAHPSLNDGAEVVAPSPIAIQGEVHGPNGKVPYVEPRALTLDEIDEIVGQFATAASNCISEAGFDGVEILAANGFLIDQFLKDGSNSRTDAYGGSLANRSRFLIDVVAAVVAAIGGDCVGVRFSPLNGHNAQTESNPEALAEHVARAMNAVDLAYVHVFRGDFLGKQTGDVLPIFRKYYHGVLVANQGYTQEEATEAIQSGGVDAIAFGTAWLANPDLVTHFERNAALNPIDVGTLYVGGAKGYNDYPTLA